MKRTTKLFAWILSAALLLTLIPFAGMSALAVTPEELDVNITFNGNTPNPLVYVYSGENIERNGGTALGAHDYRGTIHFTADGGYAVFKTAKNSPFIAQVRNYAASVPANADTAVDFAVSADGATWSVVTPASAAGAWQRPNGANEGQLTCYTIEAIGTDNQYVRVKMTGSGANNTLNYIRSVAYNAPTANYTIDFSDTSIPAVSYNSNIDCLKAYGLVSYTSTATYAIETNKSRFLIYNGPADLVFQTDLDSPFIVEIGQNAKSVSFEVSPTGEDGTWTIPTVNSTFTNSNAITGGKHEISSIGAGNQFVKIKIVGPAGNFTSDVRITKISFNKAPIHTVSTKANYGTWGSVTGGGTYNANATATATATPAAGCHFVRWTENGVAVSTENPYSFSVTADRNLVAEFDWDAFEGQKLVDFSDPAFVGASSTTVNFDHFETAGIYAYNGAFSYHPGSTSLLPYENGASLLFHVEPGSMFRAKAWKAGTGAIVFETSPTGTAGSWTVLTANMVSNSVVAGAGNQNWQIDNVGAETKFVRMVFDVKTDWTNYVRLFSVAYAPSTYVPPATYTVGVSANDSSYGTVAGGETYEENASVTVTATPNSGYRFVKWTENDAEVSTQNPYTFNATANRNLVALFEEIPVANLYTIDFSETKFVGTPNTSVNYEAFEPSGITRYSEGFGYHAGSGSLLTMNDGIYMVFRTEKDSIFRAYTWRTGNAKVTFAVSPDGAAGSWTDVTADITYTSTAGGATEEKWQIDGIGADNQYVRMTFNGKGDWNNYGRLFSVGFVQPTGAAPTTYTIGATANNGAFGAVSGGDVYSPNAEVTLTATPNMGFQFVEWTENGTSVSTQNPYIFNAAADCNLVAVFEQIPIEGLYTIDFSETKFKGNPDTSVNFDAFDDAGILAYSSNFSYHAGSKSLLTMNNGSYLMFRTELNSIFRANAWRTGNAGITFEVSSTGTAGSWTAVTPTCVYRSEAGGAVEENWQIDAIGEGNQYVRMTFTAGGNWTHYGRLFSVSYIPASTAGPDMHTIAAASNKNAFGKVEGSGAYIKDSEVTLTATAYEGYRFVKWTEDGKDVSTQNPYVFNATAGRVLIAEFEVDPDGDLPITDTSLDFLNNYAASVAQAFMSENVTQPWQAGLASDVPGANIVYKVQKNSPVLAVYRIFAETTMRPVFYGSKDAKNWSEPLDYRVISTPDPSDDARMQYFIIDGIGEENVYLKIQCVDGTNFENFAHFYVDLRELNFVANTDPSPFDKTLGFKTDNSALGGLYAFTPPTAVEQTIGRGLYLTLDHLICKENAEKVRLIVNVDPSSGFKAEFTVNEFAEALGLLPKLYGSKDGESWKELPADLFRQGNTNGIYNYLMYLDPQEEDYAFFAFEFQQDKDYTGIEIKELDDVVSDCLNSAIIVSSISYLSSKSPAQKPTIGGGEAGGNIGNNTGNNGDDVWPDSPPTGYVWPKAALVLLLLSAMAVLLFRKEGFSRLFAKR